MMQLYTFVIRPWLFTNSIYNTDVHNSKSSILYIAKERNKDGGPCLQLVQYGRAACSEGIALTHHMPQFSLLSSILHPGCEDTIIRGPSSKSDKLQERIGLNGSKS